MKKVFLNLMFISFLALLSGCLNDKFTLSLEEGTYTYEGSEEDKEYFLEKEITFFSLKLSNGETDEVLNKFVDLSMDNPKKEYVGVLTIGLEEETKQYDFVFKGRANPGRDNAYRIIVTIENDIYDYDEFTFIIELKKTEDNKLMLEVQMKQTDSGGPTTVPDILLNIYKEQ